MNQSKCFNLHAWWSSQSKPWGWLQVQTVRLERIYSIIVFRQCSTCDSSAGKMGQKLWEEKNEDGGKEKKHRNILAHVTVSVLNLKSETRAVEHGWLVSALSCNFRLFAFAFLWLRLDHQCLSLMNYCTWTRWCCTWFQNLCLCVWVCAGAQVCFLALSRAKKLEKTKLEPEQ